jgi:phage terminase large subunit-like protein
MMAGRGFGKTRAGAEWIFRLANGKPGVRVALIGANIADARTIMVEGVSGLLSVARRYRRRLHWEPGLGRLKWPNGSQAQLFSGDNADGLRGPEHEFAWGLAGDRCDCRAGRRWAARVRSARIPKPGRLLSRRTRC